MSRQERIDSTCALLIAIVLLILLGASIPQPSAAPAPIESVAVASVTEDAEWIESTPEAIATDSESEASGIAGMTVGELLRDAWTTYQAIPESAPSGAYTAVPEYAASFESAAPAFPSDHFTVESINQPGVFHVFHMVATQRA